MSKKKKKNKKNKDNNIPSTTPETSSKWGCHEGNVLLFEKDGVSIYGGGSSRGAKPYETDIIIDLADKMSGRGWVSSIPDGWAIKSLFANPIVLSFKITDMYAPTEIPMKFWTTLWEDLKKQAPCDVLVMCMGGHGRTGTVLASLLMASGFKSNKDAEHPIQWMWDNYCSNAIETDVQMKYVCDMWGLPWEKKVVSTYTPNKYTPSASLWKPSTWGKDSSTSEEGSSIGCDTCKQTSATVIFEPETNKFECDSCFADRAFNNVEVIELPKGGDNGTKSSLHNLSDEEIAAAQ